MEKLLGNWTDFSDEQQLPTIPSNDSSDNEPTPLCNHGSFDPFPYIMRIFVIVPVVMFGFGANVLNIIVFRHHKMRGSVVNWYLVVLACSDLAVLVCSFLMLSLPAIAEEFHSLSLINAAVYLQRWTYALGLMAQSCSVGMTLLVSGHRFFGVCFPFLAQRICTTERVKYAIIGVFVFIVVFNTPRWWEINVTTCYSTVYNSSGYSVVEASLRYDPNYYTVYMVCAYTVFMFALPFVLLIVMNAMIIQTVHQSYLIRQQMIRGNVTSTPCESTTLMASGPTTSSGVTVTQNLIVPPPATVDAKENKTTIMLIAVVFMFLVCNCLAFINNVFEVMINLHNFEDLTDIYLMSVEISNFLVVLNSASNIFIYWTFSVKFRRLLKHYFLCDDVTHRRQRSLERTSFYYRRSNYNNNVTPNDAAQGLMGNGTNGTNVSRCASKKRSIQNCNVAVYV